MCKKYLFALCLILLPAAVLAEKGDWSVIGSAQWLDKTGEDAFEGPIAGTALDIDFDPSPGIGFGINYFFWDRVSLEMKGSVHQTEATVTRASGDTVSILHLGDVRMYPLTAILQYHFSQKGDVGFYAGAGVSHVVFDDFENAGAVGNSKLDDDTGLAFNFGTDIELSSRFDLNLDAKYVPFETSSELRTGEFATNDFNLEPFIFSAGIRYRF